MFRPIPLLTALVLIASPAAAQRLDKITICPNGHAVAYMGWDAVSCAKCRITGAYTEFDEQPVLKSIRPGGPASGKLRAGDVLVAIDTIAITKPAAWTRMRDAQAGDPIDVTVIRGKKDTVKATIKPTTRCVEK